MRVINFSHSCSDPPKTYYIRGLPFMTAVLRGSGDWPKPDNSTDKLREWYSDRGGPKSRTFCRWHKRNHPLLLWQMLLLDLPPLTLNIKLTHRHQGRPLYDCLLFSALCSRPRKAAGYAVPTASAALCGLLHCMAYVARVKRRKH